MAIMSELAQRVPSPPAAAGTPLATKVPAPIPGTRITEAYARMVARDAYFWAWPMVNIYNRRLAFKGLHEVGLMNGVLPFAPLNLLAMLHDYIEPSQRWVACPNQDVLYGAGVAALDETPVVVQVPAFGTRFWVYQIVDLRTDSLADVGVMYGTKPGFYLLVGPSWKGEPPKGITQVFRATTNTALVVPRVFQDDTPEDKQAVQPVLAGIDMYPLAKYVGKMNSAIGASFRRCHHRQTTVGRRRRAGYFRRSSSTSCHGCWPTRPRCRVKRRATPRSWRSSQSLRRTRRSRRSWSMSP
jgi:hypothetical protein